MAGLSSVESRIAGAGGGSVPRVTARRMMREAVARRLVPGDRLASEPTLMSYFDVSRGSLRETLRVLSYLGAIDVRSGPGGGARIARPGPRVVGSALAIALQFRGTTLRGLLEARAVLEPIAARLAAQRADTTDFAMLQACHDRLAASAAPAHRQRERLEFHRLLAAATGNDVLELIVTALAWMGDALDRAGPAPGDGSDEARGALLASIGSGDAVGASEHAAAVIAATTGRLRDGAARALDQRVLWPDVDELPDIEDRKDVATWT